MSSGNLVGYGVPCSDWTTVNSNKGNGQPEYKEDLERMAIFWNADLTVLEMHVAFHKLKQEIAANFGELVDLKLSKVLRFFRKGDCILKKYA